MLDFLWLEVVVISKFPFKTCNTNECFSISISYFSWDISLIYDIIYVIFIPKGALIFLF